MNFLTDKPNFIYEPQAQEELMQSCQDWWSWTLLEVARMMGGTGRRVRRLVDGHSDETSAALSQHTSLLLLVERLVGSEQDACQSSLKARQPLRINQGVYIADVIFQNTVITRLFLVICPQED